MGLYDGYDPLKGIAAVDQSALDKQFSKLPTYVPPAPPAPPETGYIKGTAQAIGRGIAGVAEFTSDALQDNTDYALTGDKSKLGIVNIAGQKLSDAAAGVKERIGQPSAGNNGLKQAVFEGVESIPLSGALAVPGIAAAYGGRAAGAVMGAAGGPIGVVGGALAGGAGGAALAQTAMSGVMHKATRQQTIEELDKLQAAGKLRDDVTPEQKLQAAEEAARAEWQGEIPSSIVESLIYSRLPAGKTLQSLLRPGVKQFAKNMAMSAPLELGGEAYTAHEQTGAINQLLKPENQQSAKDAAIHSLGPTSVMTTIMAGMGVGGQRMAMRNLASNLENADVAEPERYKAAVQVAELLKRDYSPEAANNFLSHAADAIGDVEQTGSAPYGLNLSDEKLLQPFYLPDSFATDTNMEQTVASPVAGDAADMGDIPDFGKATVARDSAPQPIAGGNEYQQFAQQPFANAPAQPAVAGIAVEGMLNNLQPVDATGSKNSLASAVLAGGNEYQQFAQQPFANAPAQPAVAGIAVEGMLNNLQSAPGSPKFQALQWAQQQLQSQSISKFERQHLASMMKMVDPEKRDLIKYWASFTNQGQGARAKGQVQNQQGVTGSNDSQQGKTTQVDADLPGVAVQSLTSNPLVSQNAPKMNVKRDRSVKPAQDDMITAIAKLGGLNQDQAIAEWGNAIKDTKKDLALHATKNGKAGFLHAVSKTGRNLDEMREALEEQGYLQPGSSIEDMYAKIDQHLGGRPTYSNQYEGQVEDQDFSQAPDGVDESDYPFDLSGINFPEKERKRLKFLKQVFNNARNEKTRAQAKKALQRFAEKSEDNELQQGGEQAGGQSVSAESAAPRKMPNVEQQYIDDVSKRFEEKFKDAIFEIDEDQQKQNLKEGLYAIDRIPQEAERAALKGKLGAAAAVAARNGGSDVADDGQSKAAGETAYQVKSNQTKALTAWAKEHGLLIDPSEFNRQWMIEKIQGAEHDVYFVEPNRTIKRITPTFTTWSDYFNRVALHNFVFPDTAYDLKGFMLDNGKLYAVVDQEFIEQDKSKPVTDQDIFDDMKGLGFKHRPSKGMSGDLAKDQDFYHPDGVVMTDLHDANVFRAYDGTLAYIDTIIWMDYATKYQRLSERYGLSDETDLDIEIDVDLPAVRNTAKHKAFLKRMLKNAKTPAARASIQKGLAKLEARTKPNPATIDEEINSMSLDDMAALFSQAAAEAAAPALVRNRAKMQEALRKKLSKQLAKTNDAREQKRLQDALEKLKAARAKLAAENKPVEQAGRPEKDNGAESYFKKGDRVQFSNGVHGEVISVDSYTMRSAMIGFDRDGMYTHNPKDERNHMYRVRKDNGVEVSGYFAEMFNETDPAPEVVSGPVYQKQAFDPDSLLQRIKSMRDGADTARAAAGRAKKADKIKEHNSNADLKFKTALDMQAAFDAWAEQHPEEAAKYVEQGQGARGKGQDQPPDAAGTGIEGLKVTFNTAQNGIELRFAGKPDADTLAKIKANGFRWAMGKKIWYAKDAPSRRTFVEGLQGKQAAPAQVKADEKPKTNLDVMREQGALAFTAGKQRIPVDPFNPSAEMTPGMKEAWLKGWDAANLAAPIAEEITIAPGVIVSWKAPTKEVVAVVQKGPDHNGYISVKVTNSDQKGISKDQILNQHVDNVKALGHHIEYMGDGPVFGTDSSNKPSERSASDILSAAASSGVKGADEALKGLYELFGGKSLKSFPGAVDEDTYREAKPHFTAALENFRSAGKSLKEFFSFLIDQFGAGIQPYVMKYMQEKQQESGILEVTNQEAENNDDTANDSTGQGSLESGLPGTVPATEGQGGTGQGSGSLSQPDTDGNENLDAGGSNGTGSLGSKPESVHSLPGKGSAGSAVLPSGTTSSVTTPSEPRTPQLKGDNPGNYRITAADDLGGGTRGQKIDANLAAIRLVKQLDKEGRYPTRSEQAVLVKYTGWGGLKSVFDPNSTKPQDQKARTELEQTLTDTEYFEARQSVLNAHYTSPEIIGSIYKLLDHMGFKGGNVLEPTYGAGNFIGLMPEQMAAASKWYGSELDPVTSKIGKYLYPDAQLLESGFQEAEFPYGKFDLAIGNPPFGSEQITDTNKKRAEINRFKIHNYVIAKSGMHLRPGGVMAMVVTSRFMDTANPEARDYLAKQFKFLTAIRLPNDAFAKNAGTEVTTDLVFFQKLMPGEMAEDQYKGWMGTDSRLTSESGEEIALNKWFAKRPELMLGVPSMKGTMYGGQWHKEDGKGEFTLNARPGQDTAAEIEKLLQDDTLFGKIKDLFKPTPAKAEAAAVSIQMNREDIGIGGYLEENGQIFMREDDDQNGNPVFVKLTADTPWTEKQTLGETRLSRIKGMLAMREAAYKLIEAERFDLPDMDSKRNELNSLYDAFVAKHGYLSDSANASLMADDVKIESGLEVNYRKAISAAKAKTMGVKPTPARADKAAILTQRVYFPVKEITSAANARDGYGISLSERGKLDIEYISGLVGQAPAETIKQLADEGLIFKDPATGEWLQEDAYLSGNVKAKLAKVQGREGYEKNVEALTRVLPQDVAAEDIFADLGATWIPAEVYKEFADLMGVTNANVIVIPETGTVKVISGGHVQNDMNVMLQNPDHDVASLINHVAAKQAVVAYDTIDDKRVVNKDRTKALVPMVKRVSATFRDWLMADPRRAKQLTQLYNDTMNTHAPRTYNGKHLKTVGASPAVRLRNSQRNAAWRMLQSPVTLLDHVVGAGKTFTIITGVMERKRLGLSNKAMVVVPNHLVGQWGADFLKLYPGARILATTEKDFAKANRRRLFARIATGNYDAIIVGHSSFGFIPLEPTTNREFIEEEISYLERALVQAEQTKDRRLIRNITEKIAKKRERIKSLMDGNRDDVVTFESMGIDNLVVDESHEFKNLEYSTSMQNITGMGNPQGAKKSFDLYAKIQYLRKQDGAVTFATGTPISNSLVEMYTILRYLNREELKGRKLDVFDAWAKAYASIESRIEYTASQKLKDRQVMATFNNLPELLQLYSEFADVISMQDLKRIYAEQIKDSNAATGAKEREEFPIPKVKGGARYLDIADPTASQRQYMDYLVARANRLEKLGGQNDPKTDNHLWLMNDARKMALDIRLVDPSAPSDPNNKVNRAAGNIKRIYDKWHTDKGTQLVFCDLSTPAGSSKSDASKFIKSAQTVIGMEKDKSLANVLASLTYTEQWAYLKNRIERELERLDQAEQTDANEAAREKLEKFLESVGDEEISTLNTVDTGFSVYDDLKATLIDKGIPASEIRFIHEANTRDQKTELFNMVNNGMVRVLIGSSRKMGAGTNAQERLVAEHHMDAPWRPSDVEQREGRIIRQGNVLYERDPDGFEVEIPAYSTRNTFDSVSWQILARKAEMLEDFRSGARTMQDSDSDAASYAEFMAESTGNPAFREKFKLEREIEELESTERNISARRAAGERIVKNADKDIAAAEKALQNAQRDLDEIGQGAKFEVDGKTYASDLTEAYNKALHEYEQAHKEYSSKLLPEYIEARAKIEHQDMSAEDQKAALKEIKKPVEPAKPTLPRLEKTSQAARAALRVSELLDDVAERGEVEFHFGGAQVVISKVPAGNDTFDFKTYINGVARWGLSPNNLKHMSQQKLMDLFSTGEIASRVATDLRGAKAAVESIKQSIADAERTLSKLKFEDADKLKAMQERYKAVVEEVNQLEKDLDAKREQEANSYISGDSSRFGGDAVQNSGKKDQFSLTSPATTGLNAAELQQEFTGVPFKSKIKVVQAAEDLPGFGSKSLFSKMVEGQYKDGTIYLVAGNLPSVERARVVALGHELTHAGQNTKLVALAVQWFRDAEAKGENGSEFQRAAMDILREEAAKRGYDIRKEADFVKAVKEATAVVAEFAYKNGETSSLMTRLLIYLKHWLRKQGIAIKFSDVELVSTVAMMMRQGEKNLTNGTGPDGGQRSLAVNMVPYRELFEPTADATTEFERGVDRALSGTLDRKYLVNIGETPKVLQALGAKALPLEMEAGKVRLINKPEEDGGHGLSSDQIKQLIHEINDPVMVLKSSETSTGKAVGGNSMVVVTELFDNKGRPVIAAVHLEDQHGRNVINRVASYYGRNKHIEFFRREILAGNVLYRQTQKSSSWHMTAGLQLPRVRGAMKSLTNSSVLTEQDVVNKFADNQYSLATTVSSAISDVDFEKVFKTTRDNWKQTANPLDWSRTARWFDDWTPESIKAAFGYLLAVPHFQAERDATKRPFVDASENREIDRMDMMLQFLGFNPGQDDTRSLKEKTWDFFTKWQSGQHQTDWEKINQRRADLSADQKKALDALFVEGDVSSASYSTLEKALTNPRIARTKPAATTFALYQDIRNHMDNHVAKIREQRMVRMMREAGVDEGAIKAHIADYRNDLREVGGWMTRNHGDGEHATAIYHLVKDLKFEIRDVKDNQQQAYLPYFPGNAVLARLQDSAKKAGHKVKVTPRGAVIVTGDSVKAFVDSADMIMDELGTQRVMVFSRYHQTKGAARSHADTVKQDLKAAMPHNYRPAEQYEVTTRQVDMLNESMYQNMRSDMAVEALLEQSAQRALKRGDMSKDQYNEFKQDLVQNTAEVLMGRAAGRYQIRRAEYLIEGYDTENALSLYQDYMMGVAGMMSKADYAAKQFENFRTAKIPVKQWAAPYIFDSLRNQGLGDRISGNLRAFASLWYMGLKPASALINATQNYTLGIAELGRHIKTGSPLLMMAKANNDIIKGNMSQDEEQLFESAIYRQQEMGSALSEITGHNEAATSKAGKLLHNITGKTLALFQNIEVMNRKTMILAGYRAFKSKDTKPGMVDQEAFEKAMEINSSVNFNMHRGNLPGWARNPLGHTLYALQSFTFNSFNWMFNRMTSGEKRDVVALMRYAGAIVALGGASALAGGDELDKLYCKLFGKSIKLEFQQFTHNNLKQFGNIGELVDAFAWHGVGGVAGVNISNSLRLQIPVVSQVLGGESAPEAMAGVFGGLLQKGKTAVTAAAKGDVYRAVEAAAPEAVSGAMRAYRQYDRGVTTLGGKQIFDENGKPVKYSAADAALRVAGLQPLEQSKRTELAWTAKEIAAEWNSNRQDVVDAFRIADTTHQKQKALKLVQEFNVNLRGSQASGLVHPISMETLKNAAQQRKSKADQKKAAWQRNYLQ